MRGLHQRRPGVGHGGQASFGKQPQVVPIQSWLQQRAPSRRRHGFAAAFARPRQFGDLNGLQRQCQRHKRAYALEEGACAARVFGRPMLQGRCAAHHSFGQHLAQVGFFGAQVQGVGHQQQRACAQSSARSSTRVDAHTNRAASGSMPARRSNWLVRMSGKPISAVGSSLWMAASSAMPRLSLFALPAQS